MDRRSFLRGLVAAGTVSVGHVLTLGLQDPQLAHSDPGGFFDKIFYTERVGDYTYGWWLAITAVKGDKVYRHAVLMEASMRYDINFLRRELYKRVKVEAQRRENHT